jgi:uncharacterized protein with HEPN domain
MEIRDSARIAHILEAAQDIKNFIQGKDRAPGLANPLTSGLQVQT